MLLEAGADKNKRNALGWTPLHEAAFFNHVSSCIPLPGLTMRTSQHVYDYTRKYTLLMSER